MLLLLGALVPVRLLQSRLLREVALPETMGPDDSEGILSSLGGQPQRGAFGSGQLAGLDALDQPGHLFHRRAQSAGKALNRGRPLLVLAMVEVLESILGQHPVRQAQPPAPALQPAEPGPKQEIDRQGGQNRQ